MAIIDVGIGFMILIAGRPAYFVFTGGVGALLGIYLSTQFRLAPAQWNEFLVPLIFAAIGAALAFAFKRWAARVAGFLAGGYLVYTLPQIFGAQPDWVSPVAFAIAGVLCFILLIVVFDAFLMFLSSLTAVTLVLSGVRFEAIDPVIMFLILMVFGMIVQYLIFEYGKPSPD